MHPKIIPTATEVEQDVLQLELEQTQHFYARLGSDSKGNPATFSSACVV